jgi:hypothetical protein
MGTQPSAARNRNYYFPRGTLTANNDTSLHVSFTGCTELKEQPSTAANAFTGCTELKDKSSTAANAFRVSCFPRWGFMFSLLNTVCNATRLRWVDCFHYRNRCVPIGVFILGPGGTGLAVFLVEQSPQARRHKTRLHSSSAISLFNNAARLRWTDCCLWQGVPLRPHTLQSNPH